MKRIITIFVLCFLFGYYSYAQGKYENNQFSINALVSNETASNVQVLYMALPASEGFAPNVNVLIQQYSKSLKDYDALSISQFKQLNIKIIQNIVTKDKIVFEYSGKMQSQELHWFATAFKKGKKVYLITATSRQSQWKSNSKKLISCVESFKLK